MNKAGIAAIVILLALCLAGLGALAYSNWQLRREISVLRGNSPDAALLPGTANPAPGQGNTPAGGSDPFDNFFNGDPFDDIRKMQEQMQQMMRQGGAQTFTLSSAQPQIDMRESKDAYVVNITIPEGSDIELNTEVDDDNLVVSGKVSSKIDANNANIVSSSRFSRSFHLDEPVDSLGMTSETRDDTMVITLPKVG